MAVNCGRDWQDERATPKIKEWILRKLGCDVMSVEITDDQLEDAITEAQEYWLMWVGRVRSVILNVVSGQLEYPAALLGNDVNSVVDVYFDINDSVNDMFGWADVEFNPFQYTFGAGGENSYSGLVQYLQYREMAQAIVSADKDWAWDKSRRMLILSPRDSSTTKVMVVYMSRCFDYGALNTYEWKLFRDYALARAMKTLGMIRMKFADKPGVSGSYSMDGETLYANGETLEMSTEEKMRLMSHPVGIITG